jgi:hypothetical protein
MNTDAGFRFTNDTTLFLHCESENLNWLYIVLSIFCMWVASVLGLLVMVVAGARATKRTLQTPPRSWIMPIDLLMGKQVRF